MNKDDIAKISKDILIATMASNGLEFYSTSSYGITSKEEVNEKNLLAIQKAYRTIFETIATQLKNSSNTY